MQTLHFSIEINAPKEKVWNVMLGDETYREWTKAFNEGSYYEGSWDEGSKITFLGPGKDGELGGMLGHIEENRKYEFISIAYDGVVIAGAQITEGEEVKGWEGAHENYSFSEKDDVTTLNIEVDSDDKNVDVFEDMWPKALQRLKEIVEK